MKQFLSCFAVLILGLCVIHSASSRIDAIVEAINAEVLDTTCQDMGLLVASDVVFCAGNLYHVGSDSTMQVETLEAAGYDPLVDYPEVIFGKAVTRLGWSWVIKG